MVLKRPAAHSEHDATFDAAENFPAAHTVQLTAPVLVPVFVMDPARQSVHDATFDAAENFPAAHAVQVVPPAFTPVSVMDPAGHGVHVAEFAAEYVPAAQGVQVAAAFATAAPE